MSTPKICPKPECGQPSIIDCQCEKHDSRCSNGHEWHYCAKHGAPVEAPADHTLEFERCSCDAKKPEPMRQVNGGMQGFMLMGTKSQGDGTCGECATKHECWNAHNQQSLHWQYRFYSKRGRWPTWKDAVAHCPPSIEQKWEKELKKRGAWTEPKSTAPDVLPTGDETIGAVTTIALEKPKRKTKSKRRKK